MVLLANGIEGSATATAGCCLLFVWAVVLGFAAFGFNWSRKFSEEDSPATRKARVVVMVLSGLIPLSCCVVPPVHLRITRGNYPVGGVFYKIHEGMTKEQVLERLGPPHRRFDDDMRSEWYYWNDSYALGYETVWFGPDDRVTGVYRN